MEIKGIRIPLGDRFLTELFWRVAEESAAERDGNGIFINVEGLDGAGKGTQFKLLREFLTVCGLKEGEDFVVIREPGGTQFGERVRKMLLEIPVEDRPIASPTEALLFAANRVENARYIRERLAEGKIVITSRHFGSSWSYQAFGRGLPPWFIAVINLYGIVRADLNILIAVPPEVAVRRIAGRGAEDRIEQEGLLFQKRLSAGYQDLMSRQPTLWGSVDGLKSPEGVAEEIQNLLLLRFPSFLRP